MVGFPLFVTIGYIKKTGQRHFSRNKRLVITIVVVFFKKQKLETNVKNKQFVYAL